MSSSPRQLTLIERTVMKAIRALTVASEGYFAVFDEEMIRHRGLGEYLKSIAFMTQAWSRLEKQFGEEDAHILAFYSSMWNGCVYCGYGHLYAHNLGYFKRTGLLFPVEEQDIEQFLQTKDDDFAAFVRSRLARPEYADKLRLFEQLYSTQMSAPASPTASKDDLMRLSIALYSYVNECSIIAERRGPPMGKVAKDKSLIERYHQARAALDQKQPAPAPLSN
jgi:hypothetical protein